MARLRKRGGVYQAIYYDATGARRFQSTHCSDARAADAAARRFEREAQDPNYAASTTTLREILEDLVADIEAKAAAGKRSMDTANMYAKKSGHWIRLLATDASGEEFPFYVCRLTSAIVDGAIASRRSEGASESTISKELVTLRCALQLAKRASKWQGDIGAIMPRRFSPEYVPRKRYLARDEAQRLLAALMPDHAARLAFSVATSANWGETSHALRADIGADFVRLRGTKNANRFRSVPVTLDWQRKLLAFAAEHGQGEDGSLFASGYEGFCGAVRRAWTALGLEPFSSNDLRRTYCQWMRADGMPKDLVAAAMGHASTKMVDEVYGKLNPDVLAELMTRATGTPVAQTNSAKTDFADSVDDQKRAKSLKTGAEGGNRTRTPLRTGDFKSPELLLPNPRKAKRNREYGFAAGTKVAQRKAAI